MYVIDTDKRENALWLRFPPPVTRKTSFLARGFHIREFLIGSSGNGTRQAKAALANRTYHPASATPLFFLSLLSRRPFSVLAELPEARAQWERVPSSMEISINPLWPPLRALVDGMRRRPAAEPINPQAPLLLSHSQAHESCSFSLTRQILEPVGFLVVVFCLFRHSPFKCPLPRS